MVAVFFLAGVAWRSLFLVLTILRQRVSDRSSIKHRFLILLGVFAPFHRAALKKPVYTTIRYAFHACIFVVPIWFSGHVSLWEESRFKWHWASLPDTWVDLMTLASLAGCLFFFARHIFLRSRLSLRISEFLVILITGLPFLTGYFLTHGTLDTIPFFENYLWYIHVISGEIMLVMIVLLFSTTHLRKESCVGCAACAESCPTKALEFSDKGAFRHFMYSHCQCINCGSCVSVCPEHAAEMRHEIRPYSLVGKAKSRAIRQVGLSACAQCGVRFAPVPQLDKLRQKMNGNEVEITTLDTCSRCKKTRLGSIRQ